MEQASTPSATWQSCFVSQGRRSTGRSCVLPNHNVSLLGWNYIALLGECFGDFALVDLDLLSHRRIMQEMRSRSRLLDSDLKAPSLVAQ
jgi:hypothetical protein